MKQRIITAIFGITICIVALVLGQIYPLVIAAAVGMVAMSMVGEFLSAKALLKKLRISLPCLAFALVMPIIICISQGFLPIYIFTLIMFSIMIINHNTITFDNLAFAYCGTIVITFSMLCISLLACKTYSIYYVSLSLCIPWMADSSAYFIGTFWGKHKLCPNISPKKTVEGAIGGVLGGILGGTVTSLVFQFVIYKNIYINYPVMIITCLIISLLSIIGDLSFSLIKRSCQIKDFGSIMPGHGGFCDRFDSVVFTVPALMFSIDIFPFIS